MVDLGQPLGLERIYVCPITRHETRVPITTGLILTETAQTQVESVEYSKDQYIYFVQTWCTYEEEKTIVASRKVLKNTLQQWWI
jgi:hypothetical protein